MLKVGFFSHLTSEAVSVVRALFFQRPDTIMVCSVMKSARQKENSYQLQSIPCGCTVILIKCIILLYTYFEFFLQ